MITLNIVSQKEEVPMDNNKNKEVRITKEKPDDNEKKECCCAATEADNDQDMKEIKEIPGLFEELDNDRIILPYLNFIYSDIPKESIFGVYYAIKRMLATRYNKKNKPAVSEDICKAASLLAIETIDFINMSIDAEEIEEEDM